MYTKLVLCGSGEFTPAMDSLDTYLLPLAPSPEVVILPTAAGKEKDFMKWITDGIDHFTKLHAHAVGIPAVKRDDMYHDAYIKMVENAGIIYFSGGDPAYLFDSLVDTPIWKSVYNRYEEGAILAGSSAGAMIMGKKILTNPMQVLFHKKEATWKRGFGLIPHILIPHFDTIPVDILKHFLTINYVGIDEDTALVIHNGHKVQVTGKSRVTMQIDGKRTTYENGNIFMI